jgi:hypothetical protein
MNPPNRPANGPLWCLIDNLRCRSIAPLPSAAFMVVYAAKHGGDCARRRRCRQSFCHRRRARHQGAAARGQKAVRHCPRRCLGSGQACGQPFTYGAPPGREDFYFVTATAQVAPATTEPSQNPPAKQKSRLHHHTSMVQIGQRLCAKRGPIAGSAPCRPMRPELAKRLSFEARATRASQHKAEFFSKATARRSAASRRG